jgi:peptidyl-prolyl cis-trans isomerase C
MLALTLLLVLSGLPHDAPLARVGAVDITRADVVERLRVMASLRRPQTPAAAVGDLVEEALLAGEARRLGLDRDPVVARAIVQEKRRLAADALLTHLAPDPDDAELRSLYHLTGDSVRLVVVRLDAEQDARAVADRLRKGGDIAAEARRSTDPDLAQNQGKTGLVTRAALDPALAAEAFRAEPGALVGPVKLQSGWAVARVEERNLADEKGFAARREGILRFAREQRRTRTRAALLEQLRKKYPVTLDEAFLASAAKAGAPSAKDLDRAVATVNGRPIPYRAIRDLAAGSDPGGHGGAALAAFARVEIDALLLDEEARAMGLDSVPAATAALPGIERYLLAAAAIDRIAARPGADRADAKVKKELEALRGRTAVRIDDSAVAALQKESR